MKVSSFFLSLCPLSLGLIFSSVSSGQSLWVGGDGDYDEPANWDPEGVPADGAALEIRSGTATLVGADTSYLRTADTLIDGGTLALQGIRLRNAEGAPATITVEDGSLVQEGTYFIVGRSGAAGALVQNGGAVSSTVTRGFYLSDSTATGTRGRYFLNDGTLDVLIGEDASTNADMHAHFGRANNGDLFQINGGTATFAGSVADRRFYLSNDARLEVNTGGVLNLSDLGFVVLGRRTSSSSSQLIVNGGTVAMSGIDTAVIVGAGGSGRLEVRDGSLTTGTAPLWLGDTSSPRPGTLVQTGGTLSVGGGIVLSRGNGNTGQIFLRGGVLSAADISAGNGPDPRLFAQGGTLVLSGDRTDLDSEPWFVTLGSTTASYNGDADETTVTITPPVGTPATYRYYRFQGSLLRSGVASGIIQLAEFEFLNGGVPLDLAGVTISNPGGLPATDSQDNPIHPVELLIDGNERTKWLDRNNAPVVFDFGTATTVDGYRFTTANDLPERDPVSWSLEGSDDGTNWTLVARNFRNDLTPPGRFITTLDFPLPADLEEGTLTWTGAVSNEWNQTDLNWNEGGARAWANGALPFAAAFDGASPKDVTITEAVAAGELRFLDAGYVIDGPETLTLGGDALLEVVENAAIDADIDGFNGLRKTGAGTLSLGGANTYSGATVIDAGSVSFEGTGSYAGGGSLTLGAEDDSRALLTLDTSGTVSFPGTPFVGRGQNSAAAIRVLSGELVLNGPGTTYLELGGGASSTKTAAYGALHIEGGRLDAGGGGSSSGVRVGNDGLGVVEQTGGELVVPRWFAVGGEGGLEGEGLVNLLGGTATVADGFRFLLADRADSIGTLNIGSLAGGNAEVTTLNTTGLTVGSNTNAGRATLNLNAGRLTLGGPLYRNSANAEAIVNLNGGTLRAGADDIVLIADSLTAANLYRGGLTVDTNGFTARITADLARPAGSGVYPTSGEIPVSSGGNGYLGTPVVRVSSDGFGTGLTATARLSGGSVAAVALTSPGQGYETGDTLTFTFHGGGAETAATDLSYTLTASDLADNGEGTFTVTGGGRLILDGEIDATGATEVLDGSILEANDFLGDTELTVAAGATLTGALDTLGPVWIDGTLAPGVGVGLARGTREVRFGSGSTYRFQIADWTGIAGLGHDSAEFDETELTATAVDPLTVVVDGAGMTGFVEEDRDFILVDSFEVTGLQADNWTVSTVDFPGTGTWTMADNDGRLILSYSAGASPVDPYAAWAAGFENFTDTDPLSDPDSDGLVNRLEFVLLGDPTAPDGGNLFTAELDANGDFVFSFVRAQASVPVTVQSFQYGEDLSSWTTLAVPASTGGVFTVETDIPSVGRETVTVRIPAPDPAWTRVFGRLQVEETPAE